MLSTSKTIVIEYLELMVEKEVYWRGVFGCRNIISHEYGNVEPEQIFGIIKKYLPELVICTKRIIEDLKGTMHDSIFD